MAKFKLYEVRQRGEYMLMGYYFYAENHESAAAMYMGDPRYDDIDIMNGPRTDNIVIQAEPGAGNGDWCLVSKRGDRYYPNVELDNEIIHPCDNTTKKRLAFAKACESFCQSREKNPSLDFINFNEQVKRYEAKEWIRDDILPRKEYKKESIADSKGCITYIESAEAYAIKGEYHSAQNCMINGGHSLNDASVHSYLSHVQGSTKPNKADLLFAKTYKKYEDTKEKIKELRNKQTTNEAAQAIKECAIAETAIIAGDETKANKAISLAKSLCETARIYANRTSDYGVTEPNITQKSVTKAEKQLDKTTKKISQSQNKTISTNQDKGSGIG